VELKSAGLGGGAGRFGKNISSTPTKEEISYVETGLSLQSTAKEVSQSRKRKNEPGKSPAERG